MYDANGRSLSNNRSPSSTLKKTAPTPEVAVARKGRKSLAATLVAKSVGTEKYKSHYEPQAPSLKPDVAWK
jgi:hypothetical protein